MAAHPLQKILDEIDTEWNDLAVEFSGKVHSLRTRRQEVVDQIAADGAQPITDEPPALAPQTSILDESMLPMEQDASRGDPHERKLS